MSTELTATDPVPEPTPADVDPLELARQWTATGADAAEAEAGLAFSRHALRQSGNLPPS